MTRYLAGLTDTLREAGFGGRVLVVTSQGGVVDAMDVAARADPPDQLGSFHGAGRRAGSTAVDAKPCETPIVVDTGGTTFDVSPGPRAGRVPCTRETWLGPPFVRRHDRLPFGRCAKHRRRRRQHRLGR